ncbi:MAG: hypothetical protein JOZ37_08060 [Actinobacteria bacterium]|nr:hypothetical protein [Actinomycetota bacterium]MBV9936102.1 hypothetical protein [Actinomycetota bacterium]
MEDYPIKVGSALFTLVEPRRGHEVAYNRWYERDHFYAGCMIGPGNFAGRRWVATRRHKDLRIAPPGNPVTGDVPDAGSYLAVYWVLAGMHDEWNRWGVDQVNYLHANGRMFAERDHVHTVLYRTEWEVGPEDGVSLALALDHPFNGLVATLVEGDDAGALATWHRDTALASAGVGVCAGFSPLPLLADAPGDVPRAEGGDNRRMVLWFLDRDPADGWAETFGSHADALASSGAGRLLWAAPFIPTIPGTDTYTDQLW